MTLLTPPEPATGTRAHGPLTTLEALYEAALPTPGPSLKALGRYQWSQDEKRRYDALTMTEASLQAHIRNTALRLNYLHYHTHDSRHSDAGFPDSVLVRGPRVVYVEAKSETATMKDPHAIRQLEWLSALIVAGQEVWLLRPSGLVAFQESLMTVTA